MNCCNDNKPGSGNNKNSKHKGHMSHMWMMVLCCGAPIMLLILLPLLGVRMSGLKGILYGLVPFICPVMMVFMIPMMMRKNKSDGNGDGHNHCEVPEIESKLLE